MAEKARLDSRWTLRKDVSKRALLMVVAFSSVAVLEALSQTAARPAPESQRFEVASIRVNHDSSDRPTLVRPILQPGGRVLMRGQTLRDLILTAYSVRNNQLTGGPAWTGSASFDIEARGPADMSANTARALLRGLLADRFSLEVHAEQRELPIFVMTLTSPDGRLGPQLKPAGAQCVPPTRPNGQPLLPASLPKGMVDTVPLMERGAIRCPSIFMPGYASARSASLEALATELAEMMQRPVVNRTGLTGEFDIELRYAPDLDVVPDPRGANAPGLTTGLQEQLGLRLEASRGPVDVLVIDRVVMPTEN